MHSELRRPAVFQRLSHPRYDYLGPYRVVPPVSGYASLLYAFVLFIVVFPLSVVAGKVADVILVAPLKKLFDAIVPVWKPRAGHFK